MNLYETSTTFFWRVISGVVPGICWNHSLQPQVPRWARGCSLPTFFPTLVFLQFGLLLFLMLLSFGTATFIITALLSPTSNSGLFAITWSSVCIRKSQGISARSFSTTEGVSHFDLRVSSPNLFLYTCWLWHPKVLLSYYLRFYWPICTKSNTISKDGLQEDQSDRRHYICLMVRDNKWPFSCNRLSPCCKLLDELKFLFNWMQSVCPLPFPSTILMNF